MTEDEKALAIEKSVKKHKDAIKARKEAEIKEGFLNPLGQETTYAEFMEQVGKKTIAEYCKGKLSNDEIQWLEKDIEIFNKTKKQ